MARRDDLTYDVDPPTRQRIPGLPLLVLVAVVAVASVLVTLVVVNDRKPQTWSTVPSSSGPAVSSSDPTSAGSMPSGTDAEDGLAVPEGSQEAASRFVKAWLDPNPKTRKPALEAVSAPGLAEELLLTNPSNIPRAVPRGAPVLDDASAYSVQFTQALSSGMRIAIYLVADPQARYQWLATSVERA